MVDTKSNIPEFSVGDLAFSMKKTLEQTYGHVRVRGELSRISIAASGHMYSSLKDDNAVIDAICWKGVMNKLSIKPEEGLEVIATGKISTYPQRSNYQLIIESMELAGEGALLKMLEDRKKKLAAEGLFNADRKRTIPFLPRTIGVVTSPTGAVIRDILHRLADRFPCHVILWPAKVQGPGAAEEVTAGINGLQTIDQHGFPRPDTIIVARGGGSLEDLMAFNEENVVRAAADCTIPLISAIGHETDTTLIDYAADLRAPTPTGAAEMAVPVRADLTAQIMDNTQRLFSGITRHINEATNKLELQSRSLSDPAKALEVKTQTLDHLTSKLHHAGTTIITRQTNRLLETASHLKHPRDIIINKTQHLDRWNDQLTNIPSKLFDKPTTQLKHASKMLEAYSFQNTLKRGYALVRDEAGKPITAAAQSENNQTVTIQFHDDSVAASIGKNTAPPKTQPAPLQKKKKPPTKTDDRQESLF